MPNAHPIRWATVLLLATCSLAYIDISLDIASSSSDIAFNLPLTLASTKCPIAISLENKEEFIVAPKHKGKASAKTVHG
jgi:hypothetical protein